MNWPENQHFKTQSVYILCNHIGVCGHSFTSFWVLRPIEVMPAEEEDTSSPEIDISSYYPDHWYDDDLGKRRDPNDYPKTSGIFDDVFGVGQTKILDEPPKEAPLPMPSASADGRDGGHEGGLGSSLVPTKNKWDTSKNVQKCSRPIGLFKNRITGQKIPMRCNTWDCPYCGKIKKINVLKRVERGFERIGQNLGMRIRSVTLTQRLGSERNIMKDWAALRHILARSGYNLRYFWSKEFTHKGQRHLHLLINAYIPQKTLSFCWRLVTNGESYIVWINSAERGEFADDIRNPAGYMSKYLTKAYSDEVKFNKSEHRYGFSRCALFKVQKYTPPIPEGLTPIQMMEYFSFSSPWVADRSLLAMITAHRLEAG